MMKMRRFGSVALAALALGAMGLTPAEAAYKPKITNKMSGQTMKEVQKVVTTLKSMPKTFRWTFLAEKLGLMFMPDNAGIGHLENGGFIRGAHFIGCDGVEYDANAQTQEVTRELKNDWSYCAVNLERFGREVVFSRLSSEVTEIVMQNANYHLQKMAELQPERRVMYLAYLAELCYLAAGKSPYEQLTTQIAPHRQPIQVYDISNKGCKFIDPEGKEQAFDEIRKKYSNHGDSRWMILSVCAHHVGKKDILDLYPEDVKTMREYYKNKFSNLSLAKKLGVTYQPKTSADKLSGQAKRELAGAVAYLKGLPQKLRWCFISGRLGILFIPSNGAVGQGNHKAYSASCFIGADGWLYNLHSTANVNHDRNAWGVNSERAVRLGHDVVFSRLSTEVAEFLLQNANYHLQKMAEEQPERRDMYLAYLANLCYRPDGRSPYENRVTKIGPHMQPYQYYDIDNIDCRFVDTEGTEHKYDDIQKKYALPGGDRWTILNICAHHMGADAILALCPDVVKKLRATYKKRMEELGSSATEPKETKDEVTNDPAEKPDSLAKKLGVSYRPQTNADQSSQEVQKVVSVVKSMQDPIRWTFFAEKMGLCFMPSNGYVGHVGNGSFARGAHFIGGDGIEYDANSQTAPFSKEMWSEWIFCSTNLERLGREAVFSKLPNDMAEFILQNAKYQLDKMAEEQPERRDMYLAYLAELCYLPGGKSPYGQLVSKIGPHAQRILAYEIGNKGCCFVDSEGREQKFDDISKKYASPRGDRWTILNVCAHHLGKDALLALCPDVVKKLRANYKKKMQALGVNLTEQKKAKEEELREGVGSLAKKLGVTYRPQTNADKVSGAVALDIRNAVTMLNDMQKQVRWVFFAEKLGLLFMPTNGQTGNEAKSGDMRDGSHFIGADGVDYDAKAEFEARPNKNPDTWRLSYLALERLGREVVLSKFPDEVAELILQNAKYQLDMMEVEQPERRDMYLAYLAKLCYLPDGKSPYGKMETKTVFNKLPIQCYDLDHKGCLFVDTEGTEQKFDDVSRKYFLLNGGTRWTILNVCVHHLGADAILALCPKEVKKLRDNYEKRMKELKK